MCIDTVLADKGAAHAAIVTPNSKEYRSLGRNLQQSIRAASGIEIPLYCDHETTDHLLSNFNVLALGNSSNNAFIERLYRQWHVILDLKYPGPGGYVVRSLHNPYGTGHNVIFIGGSDFKGVVQALEHFCGLLTPGSPLKVGWLMEIKLGDGMTPPQIDILSTEWPVHSWDDSWRKTSSGEACGYLPSTNFGWNPISIAAVLYYMTGQPEYLSVFKTIARPDPQNLPLPNRSDGAFIDPLHPLAKSYHYRAHLVDCIYDLIEESPLFTDEERLYFTNELLQHQLELDSTHKYSIQNGDRHAQWNMLCIYTGSRYFARYYPDAVWDSRLENVRKGFRSLINNPTWGERDTLEWVSTSIEPIFDFSLMDDFGDLVDSGTARMFMRALEILMTGCEIDFYNKYAPLSLLHKAAYLLRDSRYVWMARQLGFDVARFRIGQSYWPLEVTQPTPPSDLVYATPFYPLAKSDWEKSGKSVEQEKAFQILSYRTGLNKQDDYMLIDGFSGLGRNPHHLASVLKLRMFNGENVLDGYGNDLDVWFNGVLDQEIPRCAQLNRTFAVENCGFIEMEVPNMPASSWKRYLLNLKDVAFVAIDRIAPHKSGEFEVVCTWEPGMHLDADGALGRSVKISNGVRLFTAGCDIFEVEDNLVHERIQRRLEPGSSLSIGNLFTHPSRSSGLKQLSGGAFLSLGELPSFFALDDYSSEGLVSRADFAYLDNKLLFLSNGNELRIQGAPIYSSDKPATVLWLLDKGILFVEASGATVLTLMTASGSHSIHITTQEQPIKFEGLAPYNGLQDHLKSAFAALSSTKEIHKTPEAPQKLSAGQWKPLWSHDFSESIMDIAINAVSEPTHLWMSSKINGSWTLSKLSEQGVRLKTISCPSQPLSLFPAKNSLQASAFSLLAGFKDDMLRAYSQNGDQVWQVQTAIDSSFRIGDRYEAPWFTNPMPPYSMTGVYSILAGDFWGRGSQIIAAGRPCTIEFRKLDGSLLRRSPTRWGNNSSLAPLKEAYYPDKEPLLLVGKNYTGNPTISGIDREMSNVSDNFFASLPAEEISMHAWLQRGLKHLEVHDLDGDGIDEIVYTLSGHWNELRVYNGNQQDPLWLKHLGPDRVNGDFVRGLEVLKADSQERRKVVVGTKNGWILAFDHSGKSLWQIHSHSPITCMDASDEDDFLAVGCQNGRLLLIDGEGQVLRQTGLGSPINVIRWGPGGKVFVGADNGKFIGCDISS